MNQLKFLDRWLLLLALTSLLTSCLPRQVDLGATPSPQKSLTPVFTSTSTSEPTLIPSGTPTAVQATRPPASATPLSTFSAKLTPTVQVTDEQVLAMALLNTDQNVYCSWMI